MIYGETEHEGIPLLNTRWPQRGLFRVYGFTEGGEHVEAYDWDDCEGDAVESVLGWLGAEGSDDAGLSVGRVEGEERRAIEKITDDFNARDE